MKKRTSLAKSFFLFSCLALHLAACVSQSGTPLNDSTPAVGRQQPDNALTGTVPVPPSSVAETQPADGFSLTDALDRTVTFETVPQRIVLAGRGLAILDDAVYLFPEAKERLAAVGKANQDTARFESLVDKNYAEIPKLETEVGAEQIAAFQPDLVLLKSYMARA